MHMHRRPTPSSHCSSRVVVLLASACHATTTPGPTWRDDRRDHRARPRAPPHGVRARLDDGPRGGNDLEREGDGLRRRAVPRARPRGPPAKTAYFQTVPNIRVRDTLMPRGPARNVIAIIRGSDPALRGEYVSITAHNDHVGFNHRPVDHDSLRAFEQVIRPLGADSPPHPPVGRGSGAASARFSIHCAACTRRASTRSTTAPTTTAAERSRLLEIAEAFAQAATCSRAARFCSSRTPPRRKDCSDRRGTRIMRRCRSIRSSPSSTST